MQLILKGFMLDPLGAESLKALLSADRSNPTAVAVIDHVLALGATYVLLEEPYIDQDYSTDYLNFYGFPLFGVMGPHA